MARKLQVEIIGDGSSLARAFGQASKSSSRFGSALGKTAKIAGFALGAAGIGGLAVVLKSGISEFAEASKVTAQTGAVLKSTGQAANVTAQQVSGLAEALMRKSGVDDEAIQTGENMLLTFTRIRNEVGRGNDIFNQATKATLDLSVAMGKDMQSSAILVGKALNDPVKGMTALSKAGIQFTQAQKDSIKAMVESGNQMGAQKMILQELNTQFGGSAEAIGKTLPGKLAILKESFSNLTGQIVSGLAPAFSVAVDAAAGFVARLSAAEGAGAKFGVVADTVKAGVVSLGTSLRNAVGSIDFKGIASRMWAGLQSAVTSINWGALGASAGQHLTTAFNKLAAFMASVNWNAVGQQVVAGMGRALAALGRFLGGVNWTQLLSAIGKGISAVMTAVANVALGLATALGRAIVTGIGAGLAKLGPFVKEKLQAIPGALLSVAAQVPGWAMAIGRAIVDGIIAGAGGLGSRLSGALTSQISSAVSSVKGFFDIRSPSGYTAREIGKPLADGIVVGMDGGLALLAPKMQAKIQAAIARAKAVVDAARGRMTASFSLLSEKLLRAFDAESGAHQTKAGGELAAIEARRQAEDLASAVTTAQAALDEAMKGGDANAIAEAQRALFRAQENIQMVSLAAQQITQEQAYTDQREAQRVALEARLTALAAHYTKAGTSTAKGLKAIDKIMRSFGITFAESGQHIGAQFVKGLQAAIGGAAAGAASVHGSQTGGNANVKAQTIPIVQVILDGKVLAESDRKHNAIYARANGLPAT